MSWAWWIIPVVFALVYPTAVALITLPGAVLFTWLAKRAINRSVREDRALDVSLAWPMIVVGLVLTIAVGGVFPLASPPSAVTTAVSAVPSGEYYVLGVESGFVALLPCDAATDVVHEVNTSRVTSITSRSNNVGIDDLFRYSVLNTLFGPNTIDQMLTMGPFCEK